MPQINFGYPGLPRVPGHHTGASKTTVRIGHMRFRIVPRRFPPSERARACRRLGAPSSSSSQRARALEGKSEVLPDDKNYR